MRKIYIEKKINIDCMKCVNIVRSTGQGEEVYWVKIFERANSRKAFIV